MLAALFGVGAALTLDEFALWFHLDDVYWGEDGRKSIDAITDRRRARRGAAAAGVPGRPGQHRGVANWLYVHARGVPPGRRGVCFVKGKLATGLIGIVIPIVATVGAIRLAKPTSAWARRRYSGPERRQARPVASPLRRCLPVAPRPAAGRARRPARPGRWRPGRLSVPGAPVTSDHRRRCAFPPTAGDAGIWYRREHREQPACWSAGGRIEGMLIMPLHERDTVREELDDYVFADRDLTRPVPSTGSPRTERCPATRSSWSRTS